MGADPAPIPAGALPAKRELLLKRCNNSLQADRRSFEQIFVALEPFPEGHRWTFPSMPRIKIVLGRLFHGRASLRRRTRTKGC
jgi:hypothetical protein